MVPLLETLQITLSRNGVAELAFNRPTRYNALSALAYRVCHSMSISVWRLYFYLIGLARCYSMGCSMRCC
jgi:hypothetical protein